MTTALIHDPLFVEHKTNNSPETPERYEVILAALKNNNSLWQSLKIIPPRAAEIEDLLRCHTNQYIQHIYQFCAQGGGYLDPDTFASPQSYEIALLSAGAALMGIDELFKNGTKNIFCLARPPGHHATQDQAMGFCFFNNAAIAARYAQSIYKIKNVLIIDWDVHHGNGTQDIFYDDPSVFYFSIHEYPLYPETGTSHETGIGLGKGTTLNIPLPGGTKAAEYRKYFSKALKFIQSIFTPDLIIISAGFDASLHDPLAHFLLTDQDYYEMTREVMLLADQCCSGKILSILEGGYNLDTLGETVRHHLAALTDTRP